MGTVYQNGWKRDESDADVQQFGECVCCGHRGGIAARLYDRNGENPIGMCGECYRLAEDAGETPEDARGK